MGHTACPRCERAVTLHEGRAVVAAGEVVMWHRHCWDARDIPREPVAAYALIPEPPRHAMRWITTAIVASSLASLGMAEWSWAEIAPPPPATLAVVELREAEAVGLRVTYAAHEEPLARPVGVETSLEAWTPIPEEHGRPLDDIYPSLRAWVHPVTAS